MDRAEPAQRFSAAGYGGRVAGMLPAVQRGRICKGEPGAFDISAQGLKHALSLIHISVQLMYTDPEIRTRKQIVKTSEKNGLYLALDIADAWLTRALAE